jgi:uncharacterized membrane protein (DUF485 family)
VSDSQREQDGLRDEGRHSARFARIAADPRYRELVRRRSRFTWALTAIMLAVYFGYIVLIAFDKEFLAQPMSAGSATSLGIPIGLGVILIAIVLTGIYVRRANRDFDPMLAAVLEASRREDLGQ